MINSTLELLEEEPRFFVGSEGDIGKGLPSDSHEKWSLLRNYWSAEAIRRKQNTTITAIIHDRLLLRVKSRVWAYQLSPMNSNNNNTNNREISIGFPVEVVVNCGSIIKSEMDGKKC